MAADGRLGTDTLLLMGHGHLTIHLPVFSVACCEGSILLWNMFKSYRIFFRKGFVAF